MSRTRFIILGLLAVAAVGVWWARKQATDSLEAEKNAHAYHLAVNVVQAYVRENDGRWPTSWQELEEVTSLSEDDQDRWPAEMDSVRDRIDVDFSVSSDQVAEMSVDNFQAIRAMGPIDEFATRQSRSLVETIKQARAAPTEKAAPADGEQRDEPAEPASEAELPPQ